MPTDQEARQLAIRKNGFYTPFVQREGNCDGWVSWWLRARLQGKEIWRDKYFERVYNLEAYPEEAFGRPIAADHYNNSTVIRTDPGLTKARALQAQFYGTDKGRAYVTDGRRSDKDRAPKPVARLVKEEEGLSISDFSTHGVDNANNIGKSFVRASLSRHAAKYSVKSTQAHALGLDCTQSPRVWYFDPNIGEFVFPVVTDLVSWWRACYLGRGTGGGAFGIMQRLYSAEFYERL